MASQDTACAGRLQGLATKRLEANTTNIEAKLGSNALNSVGLFQALMQKQKNHHPNG